MGILCTPCIWIILKPSPAPTYCKIFKKSIKISYCPHCHFCIFKPIQKCGTKQRTCDCCVNPQTVSCQSFNNFPHTISSPILQIVNFYGLDNSQPRVLPDTGNLCVPTALLRPL